MHCKYKYIGKHLYTFIDNHLYIRTQFYTHTCKHLQEARNSTIHNSKNSSQHIISKIRIRDGNVKKNRLMVESNQSNNLIDFPSARKLFGVGVTHSPAHSSYPKVSLKFARQNFFFYQFMEYIQTRINFSILSDDRRLSYSPRFTGSAILFPVFECAGMTLRTSN